jgi:hypothetical protein
MKGSNERLITEKEMRQTQVLVEMILPGLISFPDKM